MTAGFFLRISGFLTALTVVLIGLTGLVGALLPRVGQVAFVTRDVDGTYTLRLGDAGRGGLSVTLANYPVRVSEPVWSPDGARLTYRVYYPRDHRLYVMDVNNRESFSLADGTTFTSLPAWSPDGAKLAFSSNQRGGYFFLFVLDFASGSIRQLTTSTIYDLTPVWTADGSEILFTAWRRSEGISAIASSGGEEQRVLPNFSFSNNIAWSPDVREIAFPVSQDAIGLNNANLYLAAFPPPAPTANLDARPLAENSGINVQPAWAPDGQKIAFVSTRSGNREVYVIDLDTGETRQLTAHPADDTLPTWSSDGHWIAFFSSRDGTRHLYVTSAEGGGVKRLTFGTSWPTVMAWRPAFN